MKILKAWRKKIIHTTTLKNLNFEFQDKKARTLFSSIVSHCLTPKGQANKQFVSQGLPVEVSAQIILLLTQQRSHTQDLLEHLEE